MNRLLVCSIVVCASGCGGLVERPQAAGVLAPPADIDVVAERDTRYAILTAVHPQAQRPDPVFYAATDIDLIAADFARLQQDLTAGTTGDSLIEARRILACLTHLHAAHERTQREAAERRAALLHLGTPHE